MEETAVVRRLTSRSCPSWTDEIKLVRNRMSSISNAQKPPASFPVVMLLPESLPSYLYAQMETLKQQCERSTTVSTSTRHILEILGERVSIASSNISSTSCLTGDYSRRSMHAELQTLSCSFCQPSKKSTSRERECSRPSSVREFQTPLSWSR